MRPIAGDQSRYYLEGPTPGQWVGGGVKQLGLQGAVDEASLRAVLAGHKPGGDRLLPTKAARRRDGFDLILAAPKSVSLVAALADDQTRQIIQGAHGQAVRATLGYLEGEALWARRGAEGRLESTSGLVGAAFQHSLSAAGDPHLHTHVAVANLVRGDDGKWSSLYSRSLYRDGRAAGAVYQANLRLALDQAGLRFEWTVDRHGLGEIVGVPRAAIEAASTRHRQVTAEIADGMAGRVGRASAAPRTRRTAAMEREEDPGGWQPRVAASGFDRPDVEGLVTNAATRSRAPRVPSEGIDLLALDQRLTERHSRIRRSDVVRAAAAMSTEGATASDLKAVSDRYLATAVELGQGAWTTTTLQRLEREILAAAPPVRKVEAPRVGAVSVLTQGGATVDVVRGDLMAQAQVIEAARRAWEADGHRVSILSPTERGQARWQILAGVERPTPGAGQPTVVLVDNADRWSTADLHEVVVGAAARQAKVVLLDGGTSPRRSRAESPAMEALRGRASVIEVGRDPPPRAWTGPSWPATTGEPGRAPPSHPLVRAGADNQVVITDRMSAAVEQMVADWYKERTAEKTPRMVALGPEEAEYLNRLARARRQSAGELHGPTVEIAGRDFQAGDEVLALRRDPRLQVAKGRTVGRVTAVDSDRSELSIRWSDRADSVTVTAAKAKLPLTHAYATTPAYLRGSEATPLLSLGHIEAIRPSLHADRVYDVVAPHATRVRDPSDALSVLLAELPAAGLASAASAPSPPADGSRSLSVLADERDALAARLLNGVPPRVPTAAWRRLDEERAWLVATPHRPGGAAALAAIDGQRAELGRATDVRRDWIETHQADLIRCDDLSQTIAWRKAALGRGAEIRPTSAVKSLVGTPPGDARGIDQWRLAAERIEGLRDRWSLPDGKLDLDRPAAPNHDLRRRAEELEILTAAREVQRSRVIDRGPSLSPAGR